jgi:hypothetical protein
MDEPSACPVVALAASAAEAMQRLLASAPAVANPAGELVAVAPDWDDVLEHDPQRAALVPVALAALREPHEIWRVVAGGGGDAIEHQPHLIWARADDAPAELFLAGTRRVGGRLCLHTWFRLADPWSTLRRLWARATLEHPRRRLRPLYVASRDVLYLHPEPHVPYAATRLAAEASVFGYLDARVGFASLVGLEIQDVRRQGHLLTEAAEIAGILASSWLVADQGPVELGTYLNGFLDPVATEGRG